MENILVGLIVAAALFFSIRSFVRIYKGKESCGCGDGCGGSCRPSQTGCCGRNPNPFRNQT